MGIFSKKKNSEPAEQTAPAVSVTVAPKGGDARAYAVIMGPHVTEKSSMGSSLRKYVFKIHPSADKIGVRASIQTLYRVGVQSVHIARTPSKIRQVGGRRGVKSGYKKAIVTLKPGEKIDSV